MNPIEPAAPRRALIIRNAIGPSAKLVKPAFPDAASFLPFPEIPSASPPKTGDAEAVFEGGDGASVFSSVASAGVLELEAASALLGSIVSLINGFWRGTGIGSIFGLPGVIGFVLMNVSPAREKLSLLESVSCTRI